MAIFTKYQFYNVVSAKTTSTRTFSTFVNEAKQSNRSTSTTSVFLSHSHNDKNLIAQAVTFLRSIGVNIYIDWMDETMPEKPNGVTASKIKSNIIHNDKFILLATDAAIISRWCNWEVGIGDAYKLHADKICLLPLAETKDSWKGNEYLNIYPRIESVSINSYEIYDNIFYLVYPDGRKIWLEEWLKK